MTDTERLDWLSDYVMRHDEMPWAILNKVPLRELIDNEQRRECHYETDGLLRCSKDEIDPCGACVRRWREALELIASIANDPRNARSIAREAIR